MSERERSAANRIEIARGEVAMEWEDRLMEEMNRLKCELEQCHLDDRNVALNELKGQHLLETQTLVTKNKRREEQLGEEVSKSILNVYVCGGNLSCCLLLFGLGKHVVLYVDLFWKIIILCSTDLFSIKSI